MKNLVFIFSMVLVCVSCLNQKGSSVKEDEVITGKYWKLITFKGQNVQMEPQQEREVYFILNDEGKKIKGFAGCNAFAGSYELKNNAIFKAENIAATFKYCGDLKWQESDFLKMLSSSKRYHIKNDTLTLYDGKAEAAVFKAIYFN